MSNNYNDDSFFIEASQTNPDNKIVFGGAVYFNGKKFESEAEYDKFIASKTVAAIDFFADEDDQIATEIKTDKVEEKGEEIVTNELLDGTSELFESFEGAVDLEEAKTLVAEKEIEEPKEEIIEEDETPVDEIIEEENGTPVVAEYEATEDEIIDDDEDEMTPYSFRKVMEKADSKKIIKNIDKIADALEMSLDQLELATGTLVAKTENERFISKTQNPYTVYALNSAYKALMGGLTYKEINSLRGGTVSNYSKREKLFKLIYSKIEGMNIKKPSFPDFLKMTAMMDMDTLLFGIYAKTHLSKSDLTINCSNKDCRRQFKHTVQNESLVQLSTKENALELVTKLDDPAIDQHALTKSETLVDTAERVVIKELGMILQIGLPNLDTMLKTFKLIENAKEEEQEIYASALYIKEMYVPDYKALEATGKVSFFKFTTLADIVNYVAGMSIVQIKQFLKELGKFMDKYKMTYAISEVKCPSCGEIQTDVAVDIETLLFLGLQM